MQGSDIQSGQWHFALLAKSFENNLFKDGAKVRKLSFHVYEKHQIRKLRSKIIGITYISQFFLIKKKVVL